MTPTGWTLGRRLSALLIVAGVVLLAVVSGAAVVLAQVHRDQQIVTDRYFTIVNDSGALFLGLVDAETAVRGYALTGQQAELEPLNDLLSPAYRQRSAELNSLVAEEPVLRGPLEVTAKAAGTWYTSFAQPVMARVKAQGARSVSPAEISRGKALFDTVRADYGDYQSEVLARREAANHVLSRKTTLLFVAVVLGAVGAALVGLVLWWALRRWVTRPVEALAEETRMVRSGDLEHEVAVEGPPEIARLAQDVDLMRRRVVEQLAQVEETNSGMREAQNRLQAQAAELRRSNQDLEQFAYVASHDLQEPLRKVASFCQLLERRYAGQLDERADQYIAFAVDGAKRMQQLINDLLAFSRIGRRTANRAEVLLESCYGDALRNLAAVLEETGATVTADPLPVVWGERALLTALLQNLVSNAVKFRGEEPAQVRISARTEGDEFVFRCSDNGIGIEPRYADRIFVIFQRLHAKDQYSGTGIGLAMCKKIVEWHGGRIWLDTEASGPGRGTTFVWTLPMVGRGRTIMDPAPERIDGDDNEPVGAPA
jgi:signal transduction histidine kinase